MKKNTIVIIVLIFSVIVISSGIFWLKKSKPVQEYSGTIEKVRIGYSLEPSSALYIIAEANDFYSREGLDMEAKHYQSGKLSLEGMFKGEVDLSMSADPPIVFSSFERKDFSIIASIVSVDRYHKIIARKDRGILKPEDLRNKRIATQKASAVHYYLYAFLQNHGLSVKDVNLSFKQPDELPDLLSKGEIDAFSMREPFISKAESLLGDKAVVFAEADIYLRTDYLTAMNDFTKNKPEVIKKVLRALIRAEEFARNYPEQAIKLVSEKLSVKESEIKEQWPEMTFNISLEQTVLVSLEGIARWAIQDKLTDKTYVPNYLDIIYDDGLNAVKPEAVRLIR